MGESDRSEERPGVPERAAGLPFAELRAAHAARLETIYEAFRLDMHRVDAGAITIEARSDAVDLLIRSVWSEIAAADESSVAGLSLIALGGYGRRELFPFSDVDLMFLIDGGVVEQSVQEPIRRVSQFLWDLGLKVSTVTRTLSECRQFHPENVEFTLALLDCRALAGDLQLAKRLIEEAVPSQIEEHSRQISSRLLEVTRNRHARYGDTLFHLEPNIKECPGGLRDVHVCLWLERLHLGSGVAFDKDRDFVQARNFLFLVRVFLHLRNGRDDNILDWRAQDAAASCGLGLSVQDRDFDAAYWMRFYFRHARSVDRTVKRILGDVGPAVKVRPLSGRALLEKVAPQFELKLGRIDFSMNGDPEPAHHPEIVLSLFAAMAGTGAALAPGATARIEQALPVISRDLEDGPRLWRSLQAILLGPYAGSALRTMHALGMLELVIPEFHGIDALVIRDAYHRYTVDEHTFVVLDTLHGLAHSNPGSTPARDSALGPWASRFGSLFRDLPHPELLMLGSLLHDTGKGHTAEDHAAASARMAEGLLNRLELDSYESGLVLDLIRNHLEMSNALRRDVFDPETIRTFAERVPNPEVLRMLTLFTYADINAVHPDALTLWKAENLWRLYIATANWLDRSVDDSRVAADASSHLNDLLMRIHALLPRLRPEVSAFLEGFPQRYLQTRTPEVVRSHFEMAGHLTERGHIVELDFRYAPGVSEITLISHDRPMLFASMAGVLAAWGMNIITADAFSNAQGVIVDSFRFADTFRTLELNESERERFVESVHDVMTGKADLDLLLSSRRRGRQPAPKIKVTTRVVFDDSASKHSTLLQVVAQDIPGLLRALSLTLAKHACNIEVALVDTEGESAIDVFYITQSGNKLVREQQQALSQALLEAIEENER